LTSVGWPTQALPQCIADKLVDGVHEAGSTDLMAAYGLSSEDIP